MGNILSPQDTNLLLLRHGEQLFNGGEGYEAYSIDDMTSATIPLDVPLDRDSPLTQAGINQAIDAGDALAAQLVEIPGGQVGLRFTTFRRARETGQIALARINSNRADDDRVTDVREEPNVGENDLGLTEPNHVVNPKLSLAYRRTLAGYFDDYWNARRGDPDAKMFQVPVPHLDKRAHRIAEALADIGAIPRGPDGHIDPASVQGESFAMAQERIRKELAVGQLAIELVEPGRTTILAGHSGQIHTIGGILLGHSASVTAERMHDPEWDVKNGSITQFRYDPKEGWILEVWAENVAGAER